ERGGSRPGSPSDGAGNGSGTSGRKIARPTSRPFAAEARRRRSVAVLLVVACERAAHRALREEDADRARGDAAPLVLLDVVDEDVRHVGETALRQGSRRIPELGGGERAARPDARVVRLEEERDLRDL